MSVETSSVVDWRILVLYPRSKTILHRREIVTEFEWSATNVVPGSPSITGETSFMIRAVLLCEKLLKEGTLALL